MKTTLGGEHIITVKYGQRPGFNKHPDDHDDEALQAYQEGVLDMEKQPSRSQLESMPNNAPVDVFYVRVKAVKEVGDNTYIEVVDHNGDDTTITLFGVLCEDNPAIENNCVIFFNLLVNQYNGETGLKMSASVSAIFGVNQVRCCYFLFCDSCSTLLFE